MGKRLLYVILISGFLAAPVYGADPVFPGSGTDARSLGRGGTVIAGPGGATSVLGNPATLKPSGSFYIGAGYLRDRSSTDETFIFSVVDTKSAMRGALIYINEPSFAGFEKKLWGVAFSQSLGTSLILGESYHSGDYIDSSTGKTESLSGADIGIILNPVPKITIGYLARNIYRSDETILERKNGYGVSLSLPWTFIFSADIEESPDTLFPNEDDLRTGISFQPLDTLLARAGYQYLAGTEMVPSTPPCCGTRTWRLWNVLFLL